MWPGFIAQGESIDSNACIFAVGSSGSAEFNFRGFFSAALTPVVEILGRDEEDPEKLVIDRERNFRLSGGKWLNCYRNAL